VRALPASPACSGLEPVTRPQVPRQCVDVNSSLVAKKSLRPVALGAARGQLSSPAQGGPRS